MVSAGATKARLRECAIPVIARCNEAGPFLVAFVVLGGFDDELEIVHCGREVDMGIKSLAFQVALYKSGSVPLGA